MITKLGKEKRLSLNENFRLKYGTVDAKSMKAVYLQVESWVKPNSDEMDFERAVTYLRKIAYSSVYNRLNRSLFADKYIVDLDLRTSGMSVERRSFMCLEVTLFLRVKVGFKSEELSSEIIKLFTEITTNFSQNNFSFNPKKKDG